MLEHLRIRSLGVIDDVELELHPGLTVLTGETGAGKTMLVTALALLLGGRGDPGRVRAGARAAVVEGRIRLAGAPSAVQQVRDLDADVDDDVLVVSRSVTAEGRSRASVGGRATPVSVLGALCHELIALHGQNDQRRLLEPSAQRASLDQFAGAGLGEELAAYRRRHAELLDVRQRLAEAIRTAQERAQEADLLRFGLERIESVAPLPGEDVELAAEEQRLAHTDALRAGASCAHEALAAQADTGGAVDALTLLSTAKRCVEQVRGHDPRLAELSDRLAEVAYLAADAAADLARYVDGLDADPARLAAVQDRRAAMSTLTARYGATVADVLAWADRAGRRLLELERDEDRIDVLRTREEQLLGELARAAGMISSARRTAAGDLAADVTRELVQLAMPHAALDVEVTARPDPCGLDVAGQRLAFGPDGVDRVEILLRPHPGAPAMPLARGASGGELSRVMLALEVVTADVAPATTFVFDEVDAGVGGRAAVEIGRRLARLAQSAQVVVVTHLPQVAAFADRHLRVAKSNDGAVTAAGVVELDEEGRVGELSRMLAGLEGSASGVAHARELLATARSSHRTSRRKKTGATGMRAGE